MSELGKSARKIIVDHKKCIGSTLCMAWAPHSFEIGPDLRSVPTNPPMDSDSDIQRAIDECPSGAISFSD